ncbi:MAG: hypothetical protein IPH32_11280 [Bacteroidetes bacterium]|nr:hypothetical protein [Bacteroidota bacterium]
MKSFNIFKKQTTKVVSSKIQKLEKNQLEKVIGGAGSSGTTTMNAPKVDLNP